MTLSYGRGLPPETIEHTLTDRNGNKRTFRATCTGGRNWDVQANGVTYKNGIVGSNKFEASMQLLNLSMRDHDEGRVNRPTAIRDRIVSVDDAGNLTGAAIIPRR